MAEGNDEVRGYQLVPSGPTPEPDGWVDGAPTSGKHEHCAMCGNEPVAWVHPFAEESRRFLRWGKGHTLPQHWILCEWCETVSAEGDDETLLSIMRNHQASTMDDSEDAVESLRQTLAAYRWADRGARRLSG